MTHVRIGKKVAPAFSLDVEFDISGVTALFGPAGAGKTLILECIAGIARPDSGRILRDDVLLFDAEARVHVPPRRRACGYLPQRSALFPHMTVRQNLAFAAGGARLERHRRVAEMLDKFVLAGAAQRRPAELDAALRTRAAVARALLAAPRLLLFDEPELPEPLFHQVRAEFTGPVLLASRSLDHCAALADQLLVLDAGRILRRGTPRDVLDQPESVEVARLLGIPNLFECTIAGLDPGRNSSRLESALFQLTASGSRFAPSASASTPPVRPRSPTVSKRSWSASPTAPKRCGWNLPAASSPTSPRTNSPASGIIRTGSWNCRRMPCVFFSACR